MKHTCIHLCTVFIFCHSTTALCTFTAPPQLYMCIIVLSGEENAFDSPNPEFTTLTDVVHAAAGASFLNSGS